MTAPSSAPDRGWLLVVGGSHAEIPLIRSAQRAGYQVVTTGNRPADLGHAHADRYVSADFSDREKITDVARSVGVSAIVSGCNDFAALATAYAAEQLGLGGHDSYDVTVRLHHKDRFRELMEELGIPTPRAVVVTDPQAARAQADDLGYPVIVKPVDLTGGKGISVCSGADEVAAAVAAALAISRQPYVVVEQFMDGTRHGLTCFVESGRVGFWFADDEQYFRNPFLVSGTTTPTSMPPAAVDELIAAVELMTHELDLVDGLMHTQCILTPAGPRIIELCRRCPGDLYPFFVEFSTGYDYAAAVIGAEAGLGIPGAETGTLSDCITRHCLMAEQPGTLASITIDPEVTAHVVYEHLWWQPGQTVTNHLVEKFGIVFMRWSDRDQMHRFTQELCERIVVDVR